MPASMASVAHLSAASCIYSSISSVPATGDRLCLCVSPLVESPPDNAELVESPPDNAELV